MGGNVFKHEHNVLRLNKPEYNTYCSEVSNLLSNLGVKAFFIVEAVREKETFGDMDIVIKGMENKSQISEALMDLYPTSSNGEVVSFLYKNFQIDLIFMKEDNYQYACHYFSWNDLGNLLGRVGKYFNLKHGAYGLRYIQKEGTRVLHDHYLSNEYTDILKLLKLDIETFEKGFDTYKDLFDFVMSSPYFNTDKFKIENLNNINRVRDRKRKTYNMFLDYIQNSTTPLSSLPSLSEEEIISYLDKHFPPLARHVEMVTEDAERVKEVKQKFNGSIVNVLTGLEGKELGMFMKAFTNQYPISWLYVHTSEEIETTILKFKETFNNESNSLSS